MNSNSGNTCVESAPIGVTAQASKSNTEVFYVLKGQLSGQFYGPTPTRAFEILGHDVKKAAKFSTVSAAACERAKHPYIALDIVRIDQTTVPGTPVVSATLEPAGPQDYFVITHVDGYVQEISISGEGTTMPTQYLERAQRFSSEKNAIQVVQQLIIDRARLNQSAGHRNGKLRGIRRVTPGTPTITTKETVLQ